MPPSSSRRATPALPSLLVSIAALSIFGDNDSNTDGGGAIIRGVQANPKSRPYVAYRTSPFDQDDGFVSRVVLENGIEKRGYENNGGGGDGDDGAGNGDVGSGRVRKNAVTRRPLKTDGEDDGRCPLSFRLGSAHSAHFGSRGTHSSSSSSSAGANSSGGGGGEEGGIGTHTPPVIHPLHPDFDAGSGRQILLTADYEVLEMWTPSGVSGNDIAQSIGGTGGDGGATAKETSDEQLKEDEQYPLLFESSSFYHTAPVVHDVQGDGIADAILGDYDGSLHLVGLDFEPPDYSHSNDNNEGRSGSGRSGRRRRYYDRVQLPRLFVRKGWYEYAINRTLEEMTTSIANATIAAARGAEEGGNETNTTESNGTKWEDFEPYHTYFASTSDENWRGEAYKDQLMRGVSGDVLNMDVELAVGLMARRMRQQQQNRKANAAQGEEEVEVGEGGELAGGSGGGGGGENNVHEADGHHRRLQEVDTAEGEATEGGDGGDGGPYADDYRFDEEPGLYGDDSLGAPPDGTDEGEGVGSNWGDDYIPDYTPGTGGDGTDAHDADGTGPTDDYPMYHGDDYYYRNEYGDDYYGGHHRREAPEGWDTYEQYQEAQDRYFHGSNYLRLPPHLLTTCVYAEVPKAFAASDAKVEDRLDELLLCPVSYYFDEDECKKGGASGGGNARRATFGRHANEDGGDETEEKRGRYVASALMGYNMRWKYWSTQELLDLSTDWSAPLGDIVEGGTAPLHSDRHSGMGAWALAAPVVAKLDGDKSHVIMGTSMGLVYAIGLQWNSARPGWPVQMRHPVEQKVLVEDVVGDTSLEVFVVDTGGDIACLGSDGNVLWARNLLREGDVIEVVGTSPMSLGDVDGTGRLAIVLLARVGKKDNEREFQFWLFAIDAVTGDDKNHFPIAYGWTPPPAAHSSMPQPLLVDLHEDQHHWLDQIHGLSIDDVTAIREINTQASQRYDPSDSSSNPRPHGGAGRGLHIVQPIGSTLHIIEGSTSCEQNIDVGDPIPAMVQADDVHGTGGLDLVVTTVKGEILTLESDVVPYHPLNVWSGGVTRAPGSSNAHAHGFSSTQGVFVHPISRQFRDILGIYIPITFEIFDKRPNIANEPDKQLYQVEIRAGMSVKRSIFYRTYNETGVYTERLQIPYGPGYYAFSVKLHTTQGIVYEDTFHIGWNVNYMGGLWLIVCLPLVLAAIPILMFKRKPNWEEDDDYQGGRGNGILGRTPPP